MDRRVGALLMRCRCTNEAKVLGALIELDRWGERVSFDEIAATIAQQNPGDGPVHKNVPLRGIKAAIANGTLTREQVSRQGFAYWPGPRAVELIQPSTNCVR